MTQRPLNVGLIGLGTVGSQVAERLLTAQAQLARRAGVELCLKRVLVRDLRKHRAVEIAQAIAEVPQETMLALKRIYVEGAQSTIGPALAAERAISTARPPDLTSLDERRRAVTARNKGQLSE